MPATPPVPESSAPRWDARPTLASSWELFARRVRGYPIRFEDLALEVEDRAGHMAAVAAVERHAGDVDAARTRFGMEGWRLDRGAAVGFHVLGEFARAARHLKRSLNVHCCYQGSCFFAGDALAHLYLEAGRPLDAAVTGRLLHAPFATVVGSRLSAVMSDDHMQTLVGDLVSDHAATPANPDEVLASLDALGSDDEERRRQALVRLRQHGPAASAILYATIPTLHRTVRPCIHALIIEWGLEWAASRFWARDE